MKKKKMKVKCVLCIMLKYILPIALKIHFKYIALDIHGGALFSIRLEKQCKLKVW